MAISVQHGPSMVDYGQAIAKAAEKNEANQRMQQYGDYLAGIQSANQQYGLGLGNLGIAQQKVDVDKDRTALASRELDLKEFMNRLAEQELKYQIASQQDINRASLLNAFANQKSSYGNILQGMSRYGYS